MTNTETARVRFDLHDVEPANAFVPVSRRQERECGADQAAPFLRRHRFRGPAVRATAACLDLDEDDRFAVEENEIDFAATQTEPAPEKTEAAGLEKTRRRLFAPLAEPLTRVARRAAAPSRR